MVSFILIGVAPPAVAEDSFTRACKLYNGKDYAGALPLLTDTVRRLPQYWPGHYYLANTQLALGHRAEALKEYAAISSCQPQASPEVLEMVTKALVQLGSTQAGSGGAIPLGVAKPPEADSRSDSSGAGGSIADLKTAEGGNAEVPETYRDKEKRWHIERLRKQCSEKVEGLREEMRLAIENGERNSSQWHISQDSPGPFTKMTDDQRAAIEREYQEKINKIQEETDRAIAGLH